MCCISRHVSTRFYCVSWTFQLIEWSFRDTSKIYCHVSVGLSVHELECLVVSWEQVEVLTCQLRPTLSVCLCIMPKNKERTQKDETHFLHKLMRTTTFLWSFISVKHKYILMVYMSTVSVYSKTIRDKKQTQQQEM